MTETTPFTDYEPFDPFPSEAELLRERCTLLTSELDETNAELRACRQRIAVLVVQHGNDANELARARTEMTRMAWELSNARLEESRKATGQMGYSYGEHGGACSGEAP